MTAAAALQLALALLPVVQTGVQEFVIWVTALHAAASQSDEWTDAEEQAYRSALWTKTQDPAYAP